MVGMFIIGSLIIVGIGALIFFKIKWNMADKSLFRARAEKLEKERIEAASKAEIGGSN